MKVYCTVQTVVPFAIMGADNSKARNGDGVNELNENHCQSLSEIARMDRIIRKKVHGVHYNMKIILCGTVSCSMFIMPFDLNDFFARHERDWKVLLMATISRNAFHRKGSEHITIIE